MLLRVAASDFPSANHRVSKNAEMEPVTDHDERFYVDALQPPEVNTMRRMSLHKLEQWKAMAAA